MKAVFTGKGTDLEVECTSIEKENGLFIIHPINKPNQEIWVPIAKIDMVVVTDIDKIKSKTTKINKSN